MTRIVALNLQGSIEPWPAIVIAIEAEDGLDSVPLHHSDMERIASALLLLYGYNRRSPDHILTFDWENLVDHPNKTWSAGPIASLRSIAA